MMKRGLAALISLLLIMPYLTIAEIKVDSSVEKSLETNKEVNVIVYLKHPNIVAEYKNEQDRVLNRINYVYYRDRMQDNYDLRLKHRYKTINAFSGNITKNGLEKLRSDSNVESIVLSKNYNVQLNEARPLVNASTANSIVVNNFNITGRGQTICIIDTGINYSHESFGSCTESNFLNGLCAKVLNGTNTYSNNNNILDDNGHGTHVAGIAAANSSVKGIAPDANIIMIKACDASGSCPEADILDGIDWCTLYKEQYNISAISLSLGDGSSYTSATCPITWNSNINAAYAKNINVIVASGNEAYTDGISHPGCAANLTSVGAIYDDNVGSKSWGGICSDSTTAADKIVCFTNRFSNLDLLAPGSVIISTSKSGGTESKSGTSMATPVISGMVALLQQYYQEEFGNSLNQSRIYDALNGTGKKILDSSTGYTFSRADAYASIKSLDSKKPSIWNAIKLPAAVNTTTNAVFYVNATDTFLNMVLIEINLNGTPMNYSVDKKTGSTYNFTLSSSNFSADQNISWRFYAIDKNNNTNITGLQSFVVDGNTPDVMIDYPLDNSFLQYNNVNFLFTANDGNADLNCSLYIDNSLNRTNSSTLTNVQTNFSVTLSEKNYAAYINCTDAQMNSNSSETINFTIDLTNPIVYLSSPLNNSISRAKNFSYAAVDTNLQNCTLYGNWSGWNANITSNAINNTLYNASIASLADGNYLWNVNCRDKSNRNAYNSSNYSIEIDTTKPEITIDGIYNKSYSYNNSLMLNLSVSELNGIVKKWYNIDGSQNITIDGNATINASVSSHAINVYANDSVNNEGYSSVSFSIDIEYPGIEIISPANNTVKTDSNSVDFAYNASDSAIANCSLILDGSVDQIDTSIIANAEQGFSKTLSNGEYSWNINCTDAANLIGTSAKYHIITNVSSSNNNGGGSSGSSGSGGGSGGSGGGGSSEPLSETQPNNPVIEPSGLPLNVPEENKKEKENNKNEAVADANSTAKDSKEKIPLTGRTISLIKSAAKPESLVISIFIILIIGYFIFRIKKK